MSDTFEPFLLSLPPMLRRDPAFESEVNEPLILVLVKIVFHATINCFFPFKISQSENQWFHDMLVLVKIVILEKTCM